VDFKIEKKIERQMINNEASKAMIASAETVEVAVKSITTAQVMIS